MKPKTPFVGFDVLKRSVSMVQILERYGLLDRLHRSGDSLSGACPLHAGHNKTQFRVSISKNCWICFGDCHGGGSIVDFVARKEGIGIRDAALLIQDWFNLQPSATNAPQAPRTTSPDLEPNTHPTSHEISERFGNPPLRFTLRTLNPSHPYLSERGLSKETIATFGVGYCSIGMLAGWIAIPIHNPTGQLVAYAGRWPGEPSNDQRYKLPKGFRKSLELYNVHRASTADARLPLVVVEGFFDCMRVWQAGHPRVVGLMGSMLSAAQEELILKTAGPGGRVLLLFDEDEAGRKGRIEAQTRLERWLNVSAIRFEHEGTQPDQLTTQELQALLNCQPNGGGQ
jgi:DNA primase